MPQTEGKMPAGTNDQLEVSSPMPDPFAPNSTEGFSSPEFSSPNRFTPAFAPPVPQSHPLLSGISRDRLLTLHGRLAAVPWPHDMVVPYLVFLAGLSHGLAGFDSAHPSPLKPGVSSQPIRHHAQLTLNDAVCVAALERAQILMPSNSEHPGDTEFQCLYMGVAYAWNNLHPEVHCWLSRGDRQTNPLKLLVAMGVLASQDRPARRLILKFMSRLPQLVLESFGPEALACISHPPAAGGATHPHGSADRQALNKR